MRQGQRQLRTITATYVQDADGLARTFRKSRCDRILYEPEPLAVADKILSLLYFDHLLS
jgi:hypothetical protein